MAADGAANAFQACEDLVRTADKDRWLASLFVPAPLRADLMALYAFNIEVAGVRERVSAPLPGEVRLQWWRDVFDGEARGDVSGHPVAAALAQVIARRHLPAKPLIDLIDARVFDLYDDAMPSVADLEGYCGETSSALMQLAALVLADGRDPGTADIAGHAGVAYALTGLIRAFPLHAARGQIFVPADILARNGAQRDDILSGRSSDGISRALEDLRELARRHVAAAEALQGQVAVEVAAAFLPMALCRLYLDRMDQFIKAPFANQVEAPQWRRQWLLWRAARRARFGPRLADL
ncbi:phytoene/squalene synthase family protein [Phreatobacter stygius]|uniref:Phytoene/squalene synthase family protein n=1 Tax=Phreatobacter stygius TaxID=1940610 RepID=A0A4D7BI38_9HYPH|nr:phytoene/squalene synthase family protein [Phreatobacter stygius]QCI68736.1 phytoene/squalene synthase family protein [Phreatobacter stygius]